MENLELENTYNKVAKIANSYVGLPVTPAVEESIKAELIEKVAKPLWNEIWGEGDFPDEAPCER